MAKILVAEDEEGLRDFIAASLENDGHTVACAADGAGAAERLAAESFDLLITDLRMPRLDGLSLLRRARAEQPEMEVILLTAHGSVDTAVEAMKLGAFDYLQKPIGSPGELRLLVGRALERRSFVTARDRIARDAPALCPLSYGDPVMAPVVEALRRVARTNSTVLFAGESGTGKELAARTLHEWSDRASGPFVAINCAAISETLLESELFGHEKGAFTGATAARRGRIELADGGTFFLDEIGEMKHALQSKLLRVLQERRFERVGGTRTIEVDVRWVAATNRELGQLLASGAFREDLYHRLAVFPITLPPLRERTQDIVPLAHTLLARVAREIGKHNLTLTESAERLISSAALPGNVRQLANALERAAILADGNVIRPEHLALGTPGAPARPAAAAPAAPQTGTLEDVERAAIEEALAAVGGNRREAAERLGIGVRTLYEKLKRYRGDELEE
ncbi:MAG TPA: sigma-54 dependent transcriptional regulator [Longimicrobiales bacterium]|nr:sigma-54 dependent transcriptional regulator [Longimicrobiales bacterium]